MLKDEILSAAYALESEIVQNRRTLHSNAEVGFELSKTVEFVTNKLSDYGYIPSRCGKAGVVATVGNPGKTLLLRADMDALPMREESALPFAADNGHCHACGHDCHTAMLLGAAKLLKDHESELNGTVKLMFQPAEEIIAGAKDMIENGLMENPGVDAAFGLHVVIGYRQARTGILNCIVGRYGCSADVMRITVQGKSAHGSTSYLGVDAITVASFINLALHSIIAREIPSREDSGLLVGTISGGTGTGTVAAAAVLEASLRTDSNEQRAFILQRIEDVAKGIAAAFRATATVEHVRGAPTPINEEALAEVFITYAKELLPEEKVVVSNVPKGVGDDFAYVGELVPATLFDLGFGSDEEGYTVTGHQPNVIFNEEALPLGAAIHTYLAMRWLEQH